MFDEMIALIVATAILGDAEVTIIEILDGPKMSTLSLPFFLRRENALPSDFWHVRGASRAWRVCRVGGSPRARGRAPLGLTTRSTAPLSRGDRRSVCRNCREPCGRRS